jgi:UDP-N-acetyl-2-amino-2-deoxyglucuronate dehydrogenase
MESINAVKNFAITGVAGYIAPRHLQAVHDTNNRVVAALDPHDAVGIMDRYFPAAKFFTEFERFDRHLEKLRRTQSDEAIDYMSICSPNYLHDAHIRTALRVGAHAICEKPLVLNPWNVDALKELEDEYGKRVYNVLQLRVHDAIVALHDRIAQEKPQDKYDIELTYMTSRGAWYLASWKGNTERSGGLATNIGVHFFDMLMWIFGKPEKNIVHVNTPKNVAGYLELERARVKWFLSIDENDLPESVRAKGQRTYRSITMNGEEIEFSEGFTDLHTKIYADILSGGGFGLDEAKPAIEVVHDIRVAEIAMSKEYAHPILQAGTL